MDQNTSPVRLFDRKIPVLDVADLIVAVFVVSSSISKFRGEYSNLSILISAPLIFPKETHSL